MTRTNHHVTRRALLRMAGPVAAALAAPRIAGAAGAKKPNIILFLTDDQGWTDTSVPMMRGRADSRSDYYRTPALERMARKGMVFSNAYSPAPVCTPTRTSIQFGKTPARLRQTVVHDVVGSSCKAQTSIAQMVKAADPHYVTAHFGKWDTATIHSPDDVGYDPSDGPMGNYHGDYRALDDKRPLPEDNPKRIFSLTKRATAFMARCARAQRPFFMQVSHYALHVQHDALTGTIEKYRALPRGKKCTQKDYDDPPPPRNAWMLLYAAMTENLDTGLGMLLEAIDELGIAGSTYVIFTSDNGGGFKGNAPLKGGKANLWEGGIRVPTVVRGPGVKAGCHCDVPIAGWDFFATISDLVGNANPLPDGLDGGSLRPLFEKGNDGDVKRHTEGLVFHFPWYGNLPMSAIRLGDFKLVKNLNTGETRLFNLAKDIGESTDLSKSMPDKAQELHRRLTSYLKAVDAENIEDMRAARKAELLAHRKRTTKEIEELRQSLAKAPTGEEKERLKKQLAERQKRLTTHEAALQRLEKARHLTSW